MAGEIALVGSGEFLEVMAPIDLYLLNGRPQRAVFLPTAAGQEGNDRVQYWLDLGVAHYQGLGVEPVPLPVLDRADAERADFAAQIAGAGLVYLSGGSPGYLADTLRDTAVFRAILAAFESGTSLAGCSAGACALSAVSGGFRSPDAFSGAGLGVVPHLAVIPHFDRFDQRSPEMAAKFAAKHRPLLGAVGIDEQTALVGGPKAFEVMGRASVWWLEPNGDRRRFGAGEVLEIAVSDEGVHLI